MATKSSSVVAPKFGPVAVSFDKSSLIGSASKGGFSSQQNVAQNFSPASGIASSASGGIIYNVVSKGGGGGGGGGGAAQNFSPISGNTGSLTVPASFAPNSIVNIGGQNYQAIGSSADGTILQEISAQAVKEIQVKENAVRSDAIRKAEQAVSRNTFVDQKTLQTLGLNQGNVRTQLQKIKDQFYTQRSAGGFAERAQDFNKRFESPRLSEQQVPFSVVKNPLAGIDPYSFQSVSSAGRLLDQKIKSGFATDREIKDYNFVVRFYNEHNDRTKPLRPVDLKEALTMKPTLGTFAQEGFNKLKKLPVGLGLYSVANQALGRKNVSIGEAATQVNDLLNEAGASGLEVFHNGALYAVDKLPVRVKLAVKKAILTLPESEQNNALKLIVRVGETGKISRETQRQVVRTIGGTYATLAVPFVPGKIGLALRASSIVGSNDLGELAVNTLAGAGFGLGEKTIGVASKTLLKSGRGLQEVSKLGRALQIGDRTERIVKATDIGLKTGLAVGIGGSALQEIAVSLPRGEEASKFTAQRITRNFTGFLTGANLGKELSSRGINVPKNLLAGMRKQLELIKTRKFLELPVPTTPNAYRPGQTSVRLFNTLGEERIGQQLRARLEIQSARLTKLFYEKFPRSQADLLKEALMREQQAKTSKLFKSPDRKIGPSLTPLRFKDVQEKEVNVITNRDGTISLQKTKPRIPEPSPNTKRILKQRLEQKKIEFAKREQTFSSAPAKSLQEIYGRRSNLREQVVEPTEEYLYRVDSAGKPKLDRRSVAFFSSAQSQLSGTKSAIATKSMLGEKTIPALAFKPRVSESIGERAVTSPQEAFAVRQAAAQTQGFKLTEITIPETGIIITTKPKIPTPVRTPPRLPPRIPRGRRVPPEIPIRGKLLETFELSKKGSPKQGYNVFSRRSGKIIKLNRFALTKKGAVGLGHKIVENSVSRSFFIRPVKGKPVSSNFGGVPLSQYRMPRRKTKLQRDSLVEKTIFAINTRGEKRGLSEARYAATIRNPKVRRLLNPSFFKQAKRIAEKVINFKNKNTVFAQRTREIRVTT